MVERNDGFGRPANPEAEEANGVRICKPEAFEPVTAALRAALAAASPCTGCRMNALANLIVEELANMPPAHRAGAFAALMRGLPQHLDQELAIRRRDDGIGAAAGRA